ncbi:MAG: hypothetical protein IKZ42_02530 [Clostridiales bacterium]|nr:hypothetical protein [Clostridiales bacterium]
MENTAIRRGKVEMSVVCSDLSLLENINSLLNDNGFISVEDEQGIMHYIVDGRSNRREAAGKVTSLSPNKKTTQGKEEAYIDMCVKSVLREYGFDMSLIGTVLLYRALFDSYIKRIPLPTTMKSIYCETGKEYGLSIEQCERDVRYSISKSVLKDMRSRSALRCLGTRIERRLGYRDPLE